MPRLNAILCALPLSVFAPLCASAADGAATNDIVELQLSSYTGESASRLGNSFNYVFAKSDGTQVKITCSKKFLFWGENAATVQIDPDKNGPVDARMEIDYSNCVDSMAVLADAVKAMPFTLILSKAGDSGFDLIRIAEYPSFGRISRSDPRFNDLLSWSEQFMKRNFNELSGTTSEGHPCSFSVWDHSTDEQKESYISLGTAAPASSDSSQFTYVGMWINPDAHYQGLYTLKNVNVSGDAIDIDVIADESEVKAVENNLHIQLDGQGNVTQVTGTSSHWPGSTCTIDKK